MRRNWFVMIVLLLAVILATTVLSIKITTASELSKNIVQISGDSVTLQAQKIVQQLRNEIAPIEDQIRNVAFLKTLKTGEVSNAQLQAFACEEFNIVNSDLRSNALLVSRLGASTGGTFFKGIMDGEITALKYIIDFGAALGLTENNLEQCEPRWGGQAYPAYAASMAAFSNQADVAAAFLLNFPIFGENVGRMADALQAPPYNLSPKDVAFFTYFAAPVPDFEEQAMATIAEGLISGAKPLFIKRSALLLQAYELLFWETVGEES
ncbi:MAG: hypothetical protein QNJ37_05410 [Crocosphaera sp.]|nr:hypothetical protein [Crocosphaera sp.]